MARYLRSAALLLTFGLAALLPLSPAVAASASVTVSASIDGHAVAGKDSVKLKPSSSAEVAVTVKNDTDNPISVRTVRIEGRVMGLVFYAYDTSVVIDVSAHSSQLRTLTIDTSDLGSQAVGLIPSQIQILDAHRHELASENLTVDVQGSIWSLYGLFGLMILALTIAWTVTVALRLARGTLPENRWLRATRFVVPGIGLGLVFVFTLSALRIVAPTTALWLPVIVGTAAIMFGLGYVSPTPASDADDEDGSEDVSEDGSEDVVPAGALLPGQNW